MNIKTTAQLSSFSTKRSAPRTTGPDARISAFSAQADALAAGQVDSVLGGAAEPIDRLGGLGQGDSFARTGGAIDAGFGAPRGGDFATRLGHGDTGGVDKVKDLLVKAAGAGAAAAAKPAGPQVAAGIAGFEAGWAVGSAIDESATAAYGGKSMGERLFDHLNPGASPKDDTPAQGHNATVEPGRSEASDAGVDETEVRDDASQPANANADGAGAPDAGVDETADADAAVDDTGETEAGSEAETTNEAEDTSESGEADEADEASDADDTGHGFDVPDVNLTFADAVGDENAATARARYGMDAGTERLADPTGARSSLDGGARSRQNVERPSDHADDGSGASDIAPHVSGASVSTPVEAGGGAYDARTAQVLARALGSTGALQGAETIRTTGDDDATNPGGGRAGPGIPFALLAPIRA